MSQFNMIDDSDLEQLWQIVALLPIIDSVGILLSCSVTQPTRTQSVHKSSLELTELQCYNLNFGGMIGRQMMDKTRDAFDGFAVTIFLDEDGDYLAHLTELPNVSAFGATHAEALDELKTAWELMKECYQRDGISVPKASLRNEYEGHGTSPLLTQSTP